MLVETQFASPVMDYTTGVELYFKTGGSKNWSQVQQPGV